MTELDLTVNDVSQPGFFLKPGLFFVKESKMATDLLKRPTKVQNRATALAVIDCANRFGDNLCWHDAISNEKSMKMDEAVSI